MIKKIALTLSFLTLSLPQVSAAEIAVVISNKNTTILNQQDIKKIFLGKVKTFPNGNKVKAYDLPTGDSSRKLFVEKILNRSESRLNAYWARMLFSSKAKPPTVKTLAQIKDILAKDPNAIAYIPLSDVDSSMKVVLTSSGKV